MNEVTLDQAGTLCRAFGHGWIPISSSRRPQLKRIVDIDVQCHRCTTKRHDEIDRITGELIRRKYTYPPGYQRSRIPRPELRLELMVVLKVWGSEEEMDMWT